MQKSPECNIRTYVAIYVYKDPDLGFNINSQMKVSYHQKRTSTVFLPNCIPMNVPAAINTKTSITIITMGAANIFFHFFPVKTQNSRLAVKRDKLYTRCSSSELEQRYKTKRMVV